MAIAIIPISTLQQYFLEKHSVSSERQQRFFVELLRDFGREDLAKAMHHLYENRSDSWIRIRPEDFEELMEHYTYTYLESHPAPSAPPASISSAPPAQKTENPVS